MLVILFSQPAIKTTGTQGELNSMTKVKHLPGNQSEKLGESIKALLCSSQQPVLLPVFASTVSSPQTRSCPAECHQSAHCT